MRARLRVFEEPQLAANKAGAAAGPRLSPSHTACLRAREACGPRPMRRCRVAAPLQWSLAPLQRSLVPLLRAWVPLMRALVLLLLALEAVRVFPVGRRGSFRRRGCTRGAFPEPLRRRTPGGPGSFPLPNLRLSFSRRRASRASLHRRRASLHRPRASPRRPLASPHRPRAWPHRCQASRAPASAGLGRLQRRLRCLLTAAARCWGARGRRRGAPRVRGAGKRRPVGLQGRTFLSGFSRRWLGHRSLLRRGRRRRRLLGGERRRLGDAR